MRIATFGWVGLTTRRVDRMLVNPENLTSSALVRVSSGLETPRPFMPADEIALRHLQTRHGSVTRLEGNAVHRRAMLLRDQHRFVAKYGTASINAYAETQGFVLTAVSLVHHLAAQLLLNINMQDVADDARDACQNEVSQLARALADLHDRAKEHDTLSDGEFVAWYREQGRITGLAKKHLASKRVEKPSMVNGGKANGPAPKTPAEQVDEMFANPAGFDISAVATITSGKEGLFAYRQEGQTIRLIPLEADATTIISLSGHAPCPFAAMPSDLRFYRQMLLAGVAFVPDEMSNIPIEQVPEGDVANGSYDMLPASAMHLVERDLFSIAHARRDDGLIVEVAPSIDLGYSMKGDCFIDNLTRRRVGERLLGEADAARFGQTPVDGMAAQLSIAGRTKTLTFTDGADDKSVNLIIKERRIGSIWTYRVSSDFAASASAAMTANEVEAFDAAFMPVLLKKQKDRPVTIAVGRNGISFANDKARAAPFAATVKGAAKVQVMLHDLRRAMVGLMALPRIGGLTWHLDPNGLLLVEAATDVATYRVFLQTLEPNREQPTRSRALRERVESLPVVEAVPADMAAAA